LKDFEEERDHVEIYKQTKIYTEIAQILPHFFIKKKDPYCLPWSLALGAFDTIIKGGLHKLYHFVKLVRNCHMTREE
jgi:hypothetical protein